MVQRTVESMWSRIFHEEGKPTEIWVGAEDREAATKFATSLFPPPLYQLHSNGVVDGMKTFTFLVEAIPAQQATEKTQYGVELTGPDGKVHVDTEFDGGFRSPTNALDAANHGYRKEYKGVAVERTITTTYGPWTPIKTEETNNDQA